MKKDSPALLKHYGLRVTQPRCLVLQALIGAKKPLSHSDIHAKIEKTNAGISIVTIYRVLEAFEAVGLVHRHLSSGGVILCSLQDKKGHHIMLSCDRCGKVEERCDVGLCKHEDRIAKRAGFSPKSHLSEVIGTCASCT